jgi:hypothetical protein
MRFMRSHRGAASRALRLRDRAHQTSHSPPPLTAARASSFPEAPNNSATRANDLLRSRTRHLAGRLRSRRSSTNAARAALPELAAELLRFARSIASLILLLDVEPSASAALSRNHRSRTVELCTHPTKSESSPGLPN